MVLINENTLKKSDFFKIILKNLISSNLFFLLQGCSSVNFVSPTYANIVEIPVPVKDDKEEDIYSTVHKVSRTLYTVNISFWNQLEYSTQWLCVYLIGFAAQAI